MTKILFEETGFTFQPGPICTLQLVQDDLSNVNLRFTLKVLKHEMRRFVSHAIMFITEHKHNENSLVLQLDTQDVLVEVSSKVPNKHGPMVTLQFGTYGAMTSFQFFHRSFKEMLERMQKELYK